MISRLVTVGFVASLTALGARRARAQLIRPERADSAKRVTVYDHPWSQTDSIPIALTFSGGISLGAYEAGVNWALIEFVRRTRDSAYRKADSALSGQRLPVLKVVSLAGASAGNINAILAATETCRPPSAADTDPKQSTFWKTWVATGWEDIFPARPTSLAALGTGFFDRLATNVVDPALTFSGKSECTAPIPIGITLTKVSPDSVYVARGLTAPTQRHIAAFQFTSAGTRFVFERLDSQFYKRADLGVQILPVNDDPSFFSPQEIFQLVTASASYPVAWPPVRLRYNDQHCTAQSHSDCDDHSQLFMDGGVFDNNPVGLAWDLARARPPRGARDTTVLRLVYVDPDLLAGHLADVAARRLRSEGEEGLAGISVLERFAGGFIPTARKYELADLSRRIARDTLESKDSANRVPFITSTARAHSLVGSHMDSFAAFFGYPFRAYDFYAGVADGIHFIATNIVCDPTRVTSGDAQRITCMQGIETQGRDEFLHGDSVGHQVVGDLLSAEDPELGLGSSHEALTKADSNTRYLLTAIRRAAAAADEPGELQNCPVHDVVDEILCADGFGPLLDSLRRDTLANRLIADWRPAPSSEVNGQSASVMAPLVESPHDETKRILASLLERLYGVEAFQARHGYDSHAMLIKSAEFALYAMAPDVGRSRVYDPSTIPSADVVGNSGWALLRYAPYYAGFNLGISGGVFGWQPGTRAARIWTADVPIEFTFAPDRSVRHRMDALGSITPSVSWHSGWPLLSQLQLGDRITKALSHGCAPSICGVSKASLSHFEPQLTAFLIYGKFRVAAYRVPRDVPGYSRRPYRGSFGIADLNGLLYWIFH